MAEKKGKRVKVSTIVDGVLIAAGALLLALEVSLMVSKQKDGMPSLFGKTFLHVETGSMAGPDTPAFYLTRAGDKEDGRVTGVYYTQEEAEEASGEDKTYFTLKKNGPSMLSVGTAAILERKDFSEVTPGDAVTFYYDIEAGGVIYKNQLVTHRVIEIIDDVLYCYGDAYPDPNNDAGHSIAYDSASSSYRGVQRIGKDKYVGTVTSKNDFVGWVLGVTSQQWFVPVVVGVPLLTMGGFSLYEGLKKSKEARKEENRRIQELVDKTGVKKEDGATYEREWEKASIKVAIQMEMEEEKEKQKEIYRKQFAKAKEEAKAQLKKEQEAAK